MPHGKIKLLVPSRGFGFIQADTGDVFFHRSTVAYQRFATLCEGQGVEFTVDVEQHPTGQGASATQVVPVDLGC